MPVPLVVCWVDVQVPSLDLSDVSDMHLCLEMSADRSIVRSECFEGQ